MFVALPEKERLQHIRCDIVAQAVAVDCHGSVMLFSLWQQIAQVLSSRYVNLWLCRGMKIHLLPRERKEAGPLPAIHSFISAFKRERRLFPVPVLFDGTPVYAEAFSQSSS